MDKNKFVEIMENFQNKSNKDLFEIESFLFNQHEELKKYVVELTYKLDYIENLHTEIINEIEKRKE